MCGAKRHVRFTPKSGHVQCTSACLLCANSGHGVNSCKLISVKLETRSQPCDLASVSLSRCY